MPGRQGLMAESLCTMDFVVLDELGYLSFAQSGRPAAVPLGQSPV